MIAKKLSAFPIVGQDLRDQDIIQIASEGEMQEGQYGQKFVCKVKLAGGETKKLSMNNTSWNNMINEFGNETSEWIGKEVRVHIIKQKIGATFKDALFLTHPNKGVDGKEVNL